MITVERLYRFNDSRNQHTVIVDHVKGATDRRKGRVVVQTYCMVDPKITTRLIDRDTAAELLWAKRREVRRPTL